MSFVHLHVHSQYSLLDGALRASDIAKKAQEYGMPAVGLTDHGNLFGAIEFYIALKSAGIKPILGCEVYLAPGSRFDHTQRTQRDAVTTHLTLLAANETGYRNLCRLVTAGFFEGFYYKPRVDFETLEKFNEGIIALSGCPRGDVPFLLRKGRKEEAYEKARNLARIFQGRFYIELQRNGFSEMNVVFNDLLQLARTLDLPLVATNDCHYLEREDSEAHEVLLCIQGGKTLHDDNRMRFQGDELYFKSPDEMRKLFHDLPEACDNTLKIAEMCALDLDFKTYHYPHFEPAKGMTLSQEMEKAARQGLGERWPRISERFPAAEREAQRQRYQERLEEELKTIKSMGFEGYFLIVADFVNYAKSQNIPVGPGRGSAAGSLVAYSMGITDLDPLPYGLLFERFLNPERVSLPDIDMDFCIRGRDQVIRYVQEKYGPKSIKGEVEKIAANPATDSKIQIPAEPPSCFTHQVAQIITFGKMQARAVIRDVGRTLNMPYGDVDRIAKLVPGVLNITLKDAIEQEPRLKSLMSQEAQIGHLMSLALKLEGLVRHASIHAAGVVMVDGPLVDYMPLYKGADDEVVTQYDMKVVEKLGLIKFDFLGLRTLTVIEDAVKIIRETEVKDFDINRIPLNAVKVYEDLSRGDTWGIFQLESSGMRELIVKLRPTCFEDLIALVALYRPGPLGSGMVDDFIDRKHGRSKFKSPFPELDSVLRDTYGIIVYQEQVMQIAAILANYKLGEADLLRRAMGKKKPEEMAQQKTRFLEGAKEKNLPAKDAEHMFDLMAKFAEYGFNKSHSAAYALISYQTAYLKSHFPHAFMASLLNSEKENTDKILTYINDCAAHHIQILPPDINQSEINFTVTPEHQIRFGLSAVKNVGEGAVEAILHGRAQGSPFENFVDFCTRVDLRKVNRRVCESLIMCGAFDFAGDSRATLMENLESCLERGAKAQEERLSGQQDIFSAGSKHSSQGNFQLQKAKDWEPLHKLAQEKKSLGFFISGHPLDFFQDTVKLFANADSKSLRQLRDKQEVRIGGVIKAYKRKINRRGKSFAIVEFLDRYGVVEVVLFSDVYEASVAMLDSEEPLLLRGSIDLGEESAKIMATELIRMHEVAQKLASRVEFCLPLEALDHEKLLRLKEVLVHHPGRCQTYIRLCSQPPENGHGLNGKPWEMILSLSSDFKIEPTPEVVQRVNQFFGANVTSVA